MIILGEDFNQNNDEDLLLESPTPMWVQYMDAFSKLVEQSGKRLDRVAVYNEMENYPELNLALDIVSTEIFVFDSDNNSPFKVTTDNKIPENVLNSAVKEFCSTLELRQKLPSMARQCLKFGDSFYFILRDNGQIKGLRKINNEDIDAIEYDISGTAPLNFYIRAEKIDAASMTTYLSFLKNQGLVKAEKDELVAKMGGPSADYYVIPSTNVLRFSNKGEESAYFPFGESYFEKLYPLWKKVTLLEDSIIIYRIVRAPERRVFYIDVGKAPAKTVEKVLNQTKEEIKRKRSAGNSSDKELGITASFNPMSMQEDYFFAQRSDSRGSRVETLPGASNLDQIADVNYFYSKLLSSLRVPLSYFSKDAAPTFNAGKVGSSLVEEVRFGRWLGMIRDQWTQSMRSAFYEFLKAKGLTGLTYDQLQFRWHESIRTAENEELDVWMTRQSVYAGFEKTELSPLYLQERILKMSQEEIQDNITSLKKWAKIVADNGGGAPDGGGM